MAQQDVRYFLNGMLLESDGEDLRAVATDGHRLALSSRKIITGGSNESGDQASKKAILPRKSVIELGRLLSDEDDAVEIGFGESHFIAKFGAFRVTSKLVEGQFPDYKKVVPTGNDKSLIVSSKDFINSIERVTSVSIDGKEGVKLAINKENIQLSVNSANSGEGNEKIPTYEEDIQNYLREMGRIE